MVTVAGHDRAVTQRHRDGGNHHVHDADGAAEARQLGVDSAVLEGGGRVEWPEPQ